MGGIISRGFRGRRQQPDVSGRLPPGQYLTTDFPVLSAGPTPRVDPATWSFAITGEVDQAKRWTWDEFRALPSETITVDIHCVTKWSKLDTVWEGVSVDTLLDGVETDGRLRDGVTATAATPRTCRWRISSTARPGWPSPTAASRWPRSMAARPGCWCRTSISGRARSGCAASRSRRATVPASGSRSATTITVTHGGNSDTRATRLAARQVVGRQSRDTARHDRAPRVGRLAGASPRPARRRPPHRRGWLSGAAVILDRLRPGRRAARR